MLKVYISDWFAQQLALGEEVRGRRVGDSVLRSSWLETTYYHLPTWIHGGFAF
jgi:hypothetical protein